MYDFLLYDLMRRHGNDPDESIARQPCKPFAAPGKFPEVYGNQIGDDLDNNEKKDSDG